MPRSIFAYVLQYTGKHQLGLAILSIATFLLSAAPLELQRRIINTIVEHGAFSTLLWLALAYGGIGFYDDYLKVTKQTSGGFGGNSANMAALMLGMLFNIATLCGHKAAAEGCSASYHFK